MIIYLSSYPRSGNSVMQNLISNYFERPITGVEPPSKLLRTRSTENWRYKDHPLPESNEDLWKLSSQLSKRINSRLNRKIFKIYDLSSWLVSYDLKVPPYTKNCQTLLPGCQHILTPKNRQRLAEDHNSFFIKKHSFPYEEYFDGEYIIQAVRHPENVFESYLSFLAKSTKYVKTMDDVIRGEGIPFGSWSTWHKTWEQSIPDLEGKFIRFCFEDILKNSFQVCDQIKALTGLDYNPDASLDNFSELSKRDPKYYRSGKLTANESKYTVDQMRLIRELHGDMMQKLGYE